MPELVQASPAPGFSLGSGNWASDPHEGRWRGRLKILQVRGIARGDWHALIGAATHIANLLLGLQDCPSPLPQAHTLPGVYQKARRGGPTCQPVPVARSKPHSLTRHEVGAHEGEVPMDHRVGATAT